MTVRPLISVLVGVWSAAAWGYWAPNHVDLNTQVFTAGKPWREGFIRGSRTVLHPDDYLMQCLYINDPEKTQVKGVQLFSKGNTIATDTPDDAPTVEMTLQEWNAQGGLWEDGFRDMKGAMKWGGRRAVNHFHDPLTGEGGYTGITAADDASGLPFIDLLRKGISVTRWVMNGTSGGSSNGANFWGWPTVGRSFHTAFLSRDPVRRRSALAAAFRSLGQVQHLVEDNTVPDHARDLPHPGDGWEEHMARSRKDMFGSFKKPWVEFPVKLIDTGGLRALWDRDVYSGAPEVTWSSTDPAGLDEFVNANFLAWNRLIKVADVPIPPYDFTTIPDELGQGFKRGWRIAPGMIGVPTLIPGLVVRLNSVEYPWPKLANLSNHHYSSQPGSLPVSPIATDLFVQPGKALDYPSWAQYEDPLMARAHGYAQSVLSLALQPARAELITGADGDPLKLGVRLWNLWPASGPHSITWHVDAVQVVGIHPLEGARPPLKEEPIYVIAPSFGKGFDVPPGQQVDTQLVTVTWPERAAFEADSHLAVLVSAHLGEGDHRTPLQFSVVIPNGIVLVKQTAGFDTTAPLINATGNCSTSSCSNRVENGSYRNPIFQRVTGKFEMLPAQVDILGNPADTRLKAIMAEDTRISEVMLFSYPRIAARQDFKPVLAVKSQLALTGSHLKQIGPGHWVREAGTKDEVDEAVTFEAQLDLRDFYVPDMGVPLLDAVRASGSLFLGVFTTAGAFYLQRLIVWPIRSNLAPTITNSCDFSIPREENLSEDRTLCSESFSGTPCTNATYKMTRVQTIDADNGAPQTQIPTANFIELSIATGFASTDVRPISLAGKPVNLTGDAKLPLDCDTTAFVMVYPGGNGDVFCSPFGPIGLALHAAENTSGAGRCPTAANLNRPRIATYHRFFFPGTASWFEEVFGIKPQPPEWSFELQ